MDRDSDALITRALNHARLSFGPSYIGLRAISDPARHEDKRWIVRLIRNRLNRSGTWSFFKYLGYKGLSSEDERIEYRKFLAPSPAGSLDEAHMLATLAQQDTFQPPQFAFSYLWPNRRWYSRNYAFYREGYISRALTLRNALQQSQNDCVVVLDIKDFYPSIPKESTLGRLGHRLQRTSLPFPPSTVSKYAEKLFAEADTGVPIGPEFSHLLGHIALETVDKELGAKFGQSYTRYVDDIAIACKRSNAHAVKDKIREVLNREGFDLNDQKSAVVPQDKWISECPELIGQHPKATSLGGDHSFNELLGHLTLFLSFNPNRKEELDKELKEHGFLLPIQRVQALANYRRWKMFISWKIVRNPRFATAVIHAVSGNISKIIELGKRVREHFNSSLAQVLREDDPNNPIVARWQNQRMRFFANRLVYLLGRNGLSSLADRLPNDPDLDPLKSVLNTLRDNTQGIARIMERPGHVASSYSELHHELGREPFHLSTLLKSIRSSQVSSPEVYSSSLISMITHGIVDDDGSSLSDLDEDSAYLAEVIMGRRACRRENGDLSYLDEVQSLLLGWSPTEQNQMFWTRFNAKETWGLETLGLGGEGYY